MLIAVLDLDRAVRADRLDDRADPRGQRRVAERAGDQRGDLLGLLDAPGLPPELVQHGLQTALDAALESDRVGTSRDLDLGLLDERLASTAAVATPSPTRSKTRQARWRTIIAPMSSNGSPHRSCGGR